MQIRTILLAGAVLPFALSYPAFALDRAAPSPGRIILAQADPACPEGQECPPEAGAEEAEEGQTRRERRQERRERRQQQQQEQPAAEQAPAEEPAAEEPAAEEPAAEQPAAEQPATEEAQPDGAQSRRERRQERRERRRQQQQQEEPAADEPAGEPPAAEEAEPDDDAQTRRERRRERRRQQQQQEEPAADEPAGEPPAAEEAEPDDEAQTRRERRRERRQQEQQQGEQQEQPAGEAPAETAEETEAEPEGESTVEQQLEAQGDDEEANRVRELRRKLRQARRAAEEAGEETVEEDPDVSEEERARDRDRADGPGERDRGRVVERRGDRVIIDLGGGRIRVEPVVRDEGARLLYGARDVEVRRLENGRTRTVVFRENGSEIVTIRDRHGNIIRRFRRTPDGREVVLIDNRYEDDRPLVLLEPLPPPVITIPQEQYVVDLGQAPRELIRETLTAPPVQELERAYTLEEVTTNESVRAYVPRIDLDTITFEFGSSVIGEDQMPALEELGFAMEEVVAENPSEVYLVEGHTDAVGSDYDNLILSDERAEAVAVALSQNFDIPPENLVTEGYGEQYLKVETEEPERANRRVTVRRITPLLQTSEAAQ